MKVLWKWKSINSVKIHSDVLDILIKMIVGFIIMGTVVYLLSLIFPTKEGLVILFTFAIMTTLGYLYNRSGVERSRIWYNNGNCIECGKPYHIEWYTDYELDQIEIDCKHCKRSYSFPRNDLIYEQASEIIRRFK